MPMSRGAKIAKTAQFVVLFINIMYDSYVSEFSCSNSSENSGDVHSASICKSRELRAEQFSGGPWSNPKSNFAKQRIETWRHFQKV